MKRQISVSLVAVTTALTSSVYAGNGTITPGQGGQPHRIDLDVYLSIPVSADTYETIRTSLVDTNKIVCDLSDGQFVLGDIDLVFGEGQRRGADIWWFPQGGRATGGGLGNFGSPPNQVALSDFQNGAPQSDNGFFADGRIMLYGLSSAQQRPTTIAHELGHHVFGIGDMYADQTGRDRICGRGVAVSGLSSIPGAFDGFPYFRSMSGTQLRDRMSPFATLPGRSLNAVPPYVGYSIMQDNIPVCRNFDGFSPSELNPLLFQDNSCGPAAGFTCPSAFASCGDLLFPDAEAPERPSQLRTEFTTWEVFDNDSTFNMALNPALGGYAAVGDAGHPGTPTQGQPARQIVVQGFVNSYVSTVSGHVCGRLADGTESGLPVPELGQLCTSTSVDVDSPCTQAFDTDCNNCLPVIQCTFLPVCANSSDVNCCGNGQLDTGEDCDTAGDTGVATSTCGDAGLFGGDVHCANNCTFDYLECRPRASFEPEQVDPNPATLEDFRLAVTAATQNASTTTAVTTALVAYDSVGQVNEQELDLLVGGQIVPLDLTSVGDSVHPIYLFLWPSALYFDGPPSSSTPMLDYNLAIAMDGRDFNATAAMGAYQELARFQLHFEAAECAPNCPPDAGRLLQIRPEGGAWQEYDPAAPPVIVVGDAGTTGQFVRGGSAAQRRMELELHLENLLARDHQNTPGGANSADYYVRSYARHGVFEDPPGSGNLVESPQYRACLDSTDPNFDYYLDETRVAYNPVARRLDSSEQAIHLVMRQLRGARSRPGYDVATAQSAEAILQPANLRNILHSGWDSLAAVMQQRWGISVNLPALSPDSDPPTSCPEPNITPVEDLPLINEGNVVFVLDRSGSMSQTDAPGDTPLVGTKRLDFVKWGARAATALWNSATVQPKSGVVWFNDLAEQVLPTTGTDLPDFDRTALDGVMVPSGVLDEMETPLPDLNTNIADGVRRGIQLLTGKVGAKAVVLLTDGEANRPEGITQDANGNDILVAEAELLAAIDEATAADIQIYTIPTGTDADLGINALVASATGGEMLDAPRSAEAVPAFFEAQVNLRGQQLARSPRSRADLAVNVSNSYVLNYPVDVEAGADKLTFLVSDADPPTTAPWQPKYRVFDPEGVEQSPTLVENGGLWRRVEFDTPATGTWTFEDQSAGFNQSNPDPELALNTLNSLVTAHVENALPKCYVSPSSRIVDGTRTTSINAAAYYDDARVAEGVLFEGSLRRPDYSVIPLSFVFDPGLKQYFADVEPIQLNGRGAYIATVRCVVGPGAKKEQGERLPGQNIDDLSGDVPAFTREASTAFFYNTSVMPPLPGSNQDPSDPLTPLDPGFPFVGDADLDHIPDDEEVGGDPDGDQKPNVWDPDGNNNDVPDFFDDDPLVNPDACGAVNSAECCSNVTDCMPLSSLGLYAEGALQLRDRVIILNANGGLAPVTNAGTTETHVGVDAQVGGVYSVASVFLSERATADGDVVTAGSITQQNDVTISGNSISGASIAPISLEGFQVNVQAGSGGFDIQPWQQESVSPGVYAGLSVKQGGVAYLSSGVYHLGSLQVEPDATLSLDMSQGPIYLYVSNTVYFHGNVSTTAGYFGDLFIGYFGSAVANFETPFTGTVVAPNGSIRLATSEDPFIGSFFGKNVEVLPDVVVQLAAFEHDWLGGEPPPPPPASQLDAEVVVFTDWGSGYCANLDVTNLDVAAVSDWTALLSLSAGSTLGSGWNATFSGTSSAVSIDPFGWNSTIGGGDTNSSVGFCVNRPSGDSSSVATASAGTP